MTVAKKSRAAAKPRAVTSKLEELLALQIRALKVLPPEREYRFHPTRRWRFDFAWPAHMLAIEVEGGVWTGGRHTSGAGFIDDAEKYNAATLAGWRVLRFTGDQVKSGRVVKLLQTLVAEHPSAPGYI